MNPADTKAVKIPLGIDSVPAMSSTGEVQTFGGRQSSAQVVEVPLPQVAAGYPSTYPLSPQQFLGYCPREPQLPIVTQPGTMGGIEGDWKSIPTCPRGLEYLTAVNQLLVKQKVELMEAFTGLEGNNRYSVKNALGQKVFFAIEDTNCCTRNCCGADRPFSMTVFESYGQEEVLQLRRPLACSCCCCCCCLDRIEVSDPQGNVIGSIKEEWTMCRPSFRILDHNGDLALRIEGPFWTCSVCSNIEFQLVSLTGENIGSIKKQWSGLIREVYTKANNFGISFPLELDVLLKAVLLGATFLIDFMFFENSTFGWFGCAGCCFKGLTKCLSNAIS